MRERDVPALCLIGTLTPGNMAVARRSSGWTLCLLVCFPAKNQLLAIRAYKEWSLTKWRARTGAAMYPELARLHRAATEARFKLESKSKLRQLLIWDEIWTTSSWFHSPSEAVKIQNKNPTVKSKISLQILQIQILNY